MGRTFLKLGFVFAGVGLATYVAYRIWKDKKNAEIDNTVMTADEMKQRILQVNAQP